MCSVLKVHSLTHHIANSTNTSRSSDMKAAKSFLIAMGAYLTCWSPFCLILFIEVCTGKKLSKETAPLVCLWIGYISLNPLIYRGNTNNLEMLCLRCSRIS